MKMAMEIENPFIPNAFGRFSAGFESPLSHHSKTALIVESGRLFFHFFLGESSPGGQLHRNGRATFRAFRNPNTAAMEIGNLPHKGQS